MPEGPEVLKITKRLDNSISGSKIVDIKINKGRYTKVLPKNFDYFMNLLPLSIKSINCYGKFIWWEFYNDNGEIEYTLWNTLGMTGYWTLEKKLKHNNITFKLSNGQEVSFNDYRNFGTIMFCTKEKLQKKISNFGPDILFFEKNNTIVKQSKNNIDDGLDKFKQKLEKKRSDTTIASALLDQKVAAGCGNYLRAEALYLSKIHPFKTIGEISSNDITKLWRTLRQLAFNYYNRKIGEKLGIIDGTIKFANDYNRIFLVYQQKTDINGKSIKKEKLNGRTIHYVE